MKNTFDKGLINEEMTEKEKELLKEFAECYNFYDFYNENADFKAGFVAGIQVFYLRMCRKHRCDLAEFLSLNLFKF